MRPRVTSSTVTFAQPFRLSGVAEAQPAGTYTVETNEELLPTSFSAYRRTSTILRLPARSGSTVLEQAVDIDPAELASLLESDTAPAAEPPKGVDDAVPMQVAVTGWRFGSRICLGFNETELTWAALVLGLVLLIAVYVVQ